MNLKPLTRYPLLSTLSILCIGCLAAAMANTGIGGRFACGTWNLDCFFVAVAISFTAILSTTPLLWSAAHRRDNSTSYRLIAWVAFSLASVVCICGALVALVIFGRFL